jgi:UDP-N-acetylglucosamine 2-epimerase (non-hydrolysing)
MKVLFIFGTRPEAIKMAPLIHELRRHSHFEVLVCSTGQHREMLSQVSDFFEITPDYELTIMKQNQKLPDLNASLITSLNKILKKVMPDITLVQGDTMTTFVAALCSYYNGIPVGHVEAGLRSGEKRSPFPEEMNRMLTTRIADIHFTPTVKARDCLLKEGIPSHCVHVTGNTVIDALLWASKKVKSMPLNTLDKQLSKIDFNKRVILITSHRRESFGEPLKRICSAIKELAQDRSIEIVYPVHLNPNVRKPVFSLLKGRTNIHLLKPLSYPNLVYLMKKSYLILTDSGGIQEEAPSLGKPVLVMRDVTERLEGIESGVSKLVGTSKQNIVNEVSKLVKNNNAYKKMVKGVNPYGDGKASRRISNILQKYGRSR